MNKRTRLTIRKYLTLTRAGIIEALSFRVSYIVTILGNLVYLIVIYYLWKAIYASSSTDVVNGMTFTDTMIYLVLATALSSFFEVYLVWQIGRNIQSGKIILDIIKPMEFQIYTFFYVSGNYVVAFIATFLPTFILVYFLTGGAIAIGTNLVFFIVSIIMGLIINFCIDFFVATICLFTQSTWGINIMKEVIILFVSGATIPIAFFPEPLKTIVGYLPFQAIYNTPLLFLVDESLTMDKSIKMLLVQLFWVFFVILASRLFWKKSIKIMTVNGG
jgi:ABC-type uncharacterized transport system permease subunit